MVKVYAIYKVSCIFFSLCNCIRGKENIALYLFVIEAKDMGGSIQKKFYVVFKGRYLGTLPR